MDRLTAAEKAFECMVARAYEEDNDSDGKKQIIQALTSMMNNTELSDLLFVCNDGVSLYACRLWLRARSLVFRKALSPDIKEIALDDVSSRELSIVFEFLYTGSVPSFVGHINEDQMDRWSKGLATIRAARHLLLPELERLIWKFLIIDVCKSAADKDLANTAVRLSTLLDFISGYESAGEVEETISLKLVRILHPGWLGMTSITSLSEDALLFLLDNTGSNHDSQYGDEAVASLREYLQLRQVLLWCISQRLEVDPAVNMLEQSLPCASAAVKLLKEAGANCVISRSSPPRKRVPVASMLAKVVLAEGSFKTIFFPFINLRLIHPILLDRVVEPLKIIPPSKYMEAYRFHAVKRPFSFHTHNFTWQYYQGSFEIAEGGTLLKTREGSNGTALVSSAVSWEDRTYKWDVIIERVQANRVHEGIAFQWEVGMIMSDTPEIPCESLRFTLASQNNGWALIRSSDDRVFIKRGVIPGEEDQADWILYSTVPHSEDGDVATEVRVGVRLNMRQKTCSFTLNGVDLGVAWTDLPSKYYFPAVSFFSNSMYSLPQEEVASNLGTTVRVELLHGFDFEQNYSVQKRSKSCVTALSGSSASGADVCQPDIIQTKSSPTASSI